MQQWYALYVFLYSYKKILWDPTSFDRSGPYDLQRLNKQRVLTPGHQGWNDLHSRIGMEYYLPNNDDNDNNDDDDDDDDNNNKDDDDDNRNINKNDNDYNHNNDTNNDNNENDNDKNSSDSKPVTV